MVNARRHAAWMVAAALLTLQAGASGLRAQDRFAGAARLVQEARPRMGAPGVSVAVAVDDQLAWSAGDGLADVENGVAATADTVYRIASISKTMTATAVMQLVERGRVSLDDPIQKYVPSFPDKGGLTITLREILTHTSGIRHYKPGEMESLTPYDSVADAIKIFKDDPLLFTPGTKYSYSTYAFNLLEGVVESASGLTFEAYLQEHVWNPAGMAHTYLEHPQTIVAHRARQYVRGGPEGVLNAPYADLSIKWGGGGIISTVGDLIRFHIALDDGRLLKPETLQEMYTPGTLADGTRIDYGLGWMLLTDRSGHHWIAHSGGATGGTTFLLRDPPRKLAVAIMCNVQNAGGIGALAMAVANSVAPAR
jgi:CubicO group peptidase (beta-lactamase class C family)